MIATFCLWILLMPLFGYLAMTLLATFGFCKIMKLEGWRKPLFLSVGTTLFIYLMFDYWLYIDLPRGESWDRGNDMEGLHQLLNGFINSLTLVNLLACFIGALVGTVVGVLPGLGPTVTMALMLPFTVKYGPVTGLIMMTGVWYGAMYGGVDHLDPR